MKNFLSSLSNKEFSIATSCDFYQTKNGSGFNFKIESNIRSIYFHAPKITNLASGKYIVCFSASKVVEGRNDAIAVITETEFKDYVRSEVCSSLFSTEFIQFIGRDASLAKIAEQEIWQKVEELFAVETSVNEEEVSRVIANCTALQFQEPLLLIELSKGQIRTLELFEEKFIQTGLVKKLSSAIRERAAIVLFDNFDNIAKQVSLCIHNNMLIVEMNALAAKAIIATPKLIDSFELNVLKQVCATATFNPNKEEFEHLFSVAEQSRAKVVAQYLPIEWISDFSEYASLTQLLDYLLVSEDKKAEAILEQLFIRIEASNGKLSQEDTAKLNNALKKDNLKSCISTYFAKLNDAKAVLLCVLSECTDTAAVVKSAVKSLLLDFSSQESRCFIKAWRTDLAVQYLDGSILEAISQNYSAFLGAFSEGQETLCEALPLEHLHLYAKYVNESRLNEYLKIHGAASSLDTLFLLRTSATGNNYFESLLLISLFERKTRQGGASVQHITALFDDFQKGLFEHHAKSRTRIELSIISPCQYLNQEQVNSSYKSTRRTICEGKLWFAKVKGDNGEIIGEEPKALCRRNDCTMCVFSGMENTDPFEGKQYRQHNISLPRKLTFQSLAFYSIAFDLFSITPEQLHKHEAFVRMLSAINRWNEILEKLICRSCDDPLQISEHAKGSIGHLAVGTTYWHCGSENCASYGESVKISYCIGCQKYIDSRDDKKSCTPYEIRSYKKFYICNDCGSCCSKHNGFAGICPHCGKSGAFADTTQQGRIRAECKHCKAVTNIGYFAFDALQKHKENGGIFTHIRSFSKSSSHLAGAVVDNMGNAHWLVGDAPWDNQTLYIYDLYESLRTNKITRQMLSKYNEVYDLKVIEKLALLGVNHSRYGSQEAQSALDKLFNESIAEGSFRKSQDAIFDLVRRYFQTLHDTNMWNHYNNIEHKFITSLHALSEHGLNLRESDLKEELLTLERSRNQYVQKLSSLKIFDIDKSSLINYLTDKFTLNEAKLLIGQLERHGAKPIRSNDCSFEYLHKIEKTERAASIVQKLLCLPTNVKPHYQIVGTSTSRCTSRSPNLMNLPKESRHILKASYGNSIIECDYKQMEIGVLAALSEDQQLITDFNTGDVYEKFGTALTITRDQAKVILLGLIYGMSASTIATQLGVTKTIAEGYINGFFIRYPDVKKYQNELVTQGTNQGYVTSCTGLRRSVNRKVVKSSLTLNWEQNWFKNFPIQASAASVFKLSIIELARELRGEQFKLLVPHYDAIVFEVPEAQANHYIVQVKAAMHRAMKKQFPVLDPQIETKSSGNSWGKESDNRAMTNHSEAFSIFGNDDIPF
ncbi:DNA polymerase [Aliivibrio fischeri]|uniref:DNA polymerase n=1 Tax=Aliivibrio fischeri TaxID=668 RepID=UPI0012DA434E|nr:DNA polymerase [Aliivibrio fischeri]MUL15826.1 hypothetical protein [Aliivibrio fischeri]